MDLTPNELTIVESSRALTANELEQRRVTQELARLSVVLVDLRKTHANLTAAARVALKCSGLPTFVSTPHVDHQ